jgi:hypothetical protein
MMLKELYVLSLVAKQVDEPQTLELCQRWAGRESRARSVRLRVRLFESIIVITKSLSWKCD